MSAREPTPGRPHMPGYGISAAEAGGVLPWSWAAERLTRAHNYWVATAGEKGTPQLTAVWGVWLDLAFIFSSAANSRKARNIAENPNCTISTEQADEAVIVEGLATAVVDPISLQQFKNAYDPKYKWEIEIDRGGIYKVTPRVAFAFIEQADKFQSTATRWKFDS